MSQSIARAKKPQRRSPINGHARRELDRELREAAARTAERRRWRDLWEAERKQDDDHNLAAMQHRAEVAEAELERLRVAELDRGDDRGIDDDDRAVARRATDRLIVRPGKEPALGLISYRTTAGKAGLDWCPTVVDLGDDPITGKKINVELTIKHRIAAMIAGAAKGRRTWLLMGLAQWPEAFRRTVFSVLAGQEETLFAFSSAPDAETYMTLAAAADAKLRDAAERGRTKSLPALAEVLRDACAATWPNDPARGAKRLMLSCSAAGLAVPAKAEAERGIVRAAKEQRLLGVKLAQADQAEWLAAQWIAEHRPRDGAADQLSGVVVVGAEANAIYVYGRDHRWRKRSDKELATELRAFYLGSRHQQVPISRESIALALETVRATAPRILEDIPLPAYYDHEAASWHPSPFTAVENGLLDLDKVLAGESHHAELWPHSANHVATQSLPYSYDQDATCKYTSRILAEILPEKRAATAPGETGKLRLRTDNRIGLLFEAAGLALARGRVPDPHFLVLVGEGSTGKSVVLDGVLTAILGEDNVSAVPLDRLGDRFGLPALAGKLASICSDARQIEKVDEGLLKQIVSGEKVRIEDKYQPIYYDRIKAKFFFAANELPRFSDASDGLYRRLVIVPFERRFADEADDKRLGYTAEQTGQVKRADPQVLERVRQEAPGLLNRAIEALFLRAARGRILHCEVCAEAGRQHRHECDSIAVWAAERLKLGGTDRTATGELYRDYAAWCKQGRREPYAAYQFGQRLARLLVRQGIQTSRWNHNTIRGYIGVRIVGSW